MAHLSKGFARIDESDMIASPDPATFVILPWRPKEKAVARMFCDIHEPDGSPYKGDPRYILKINLEKARQERVYLESRAGTRILLL